MVVEIQHKCGGSEGQGESEYLALVPPTQNT